MFVFRTKMPVDVATSDAEQYMIDFLDKLLTEAHIKTPQTCTQGAGCCKDTCRDARKPEEPKKKQSLVEGRINYGCMSIDVIDFTRSLSPYEAVQLRRALELTHKI